MHNNTTSKYLHRLVAQAKQKGIDKNRRYKVIKHHANVVIQSASGHSSARIPHHSVQRNLSRHNLPAHLDDLVPGHFNLRRTAHVVNPSFAVGVVQEIPSSNQHSIHCNVHWQVIAIPVWEKGKEIVWCNMMTWFKPRLRDSPLSQYIVRITPFPAPIKSPVGPLILSVQPGIGSW